MAHTCDDGAEAALRRCVLCSVSGRSLSAVGSTLSQPLPTRRLLMMAACPVFHAPTIHPSSCYIAAVSASRWLLRGGCTHLCRVVRLPESTGDHVVLELLVGGFRMQLQGGGQVVGAGWIAAGRAGAAAFRGCRNGRSRPSSPGSGTLAQTGQGSRDRRRHSTTATGGARRLQRCDR